VQAVTRRRFDQPSTLVITVERRGRKSLTVSIRGSTIGVLLALSILAGIAWIAMR
jgi:hypothetical protein